MKTLEDSAGTRRKVARWLEPISEVLTIMLLAIMAVLTAWCGFQASKWGGEMSIAFSNASSARTQAINADGESRDARLYDLSMFTQWVLADQTNDEDLSRYIEERFTPEFDVAFNQWIAEGRASRGPMMMDSYVPPGTQEAKDLNAKADQRYQAALDFNQQGDDYSLMTVIFALVLFLTAISQRIVVSWARFGMLVMALVMAVGAIMVLVSFPIKI